MLEPGDAPSFVHSPSTLDAQHLQLDHFLREVERRALHIARLSTRNVDDALELTQEAMLGFVRHYVGHPQSDWRPLFFRVLDSRIQDFHRRSSVRGRLLGFLRRDDNTPEQDPLDQIADLETPAPLEQLAGEQAGAALSDALRALPDRQRQAFLLRIWEGFDVSETAAVMRCSQGSVKTHLFRAMHALRARLEAHR